LKLAEVIASRCRLSLDIRTDLLHGAAWDAHGTFCRDETVAAARAADAVLVGAVGGPRWDGIKVSGGAEMQDGLMRLRKELDTYAGIRPARACSALAHLTPYRPGLLDGVDVLVLRELTGGAFFAEPRGTELRAGRRYAFDTAAYDEDEIARVAHVGFQLARVRRRRLVSTDKANVMESCLLWRRVVSEVGREYPDVELTHLYADNAVYQLARRPAEFDVILGDNLFGDILSDQAGGFAGSLGMLPSACLCGLPDGTTRRPGIFEPVHGSAPDLAGQGIANPIGALLSVALMFEYAFGEAEEARRVEHAVDVALESGHRTPDIGGTASSVAVTDAIISAYRSLL
jgi:3-isopropylmalate dehydrogenase